MSDAPTPPPGWGQPPQQPGPPPQPPGPPPQGWQAPGPASAPQGWGQPPAHPPQGGYGYPNPPQGGYTAPPQRGGGGRTAVLVVVIAVVLIAAVGAAIAFLSGGEDGEADTFSSEVADGVSELTSPPTAAGGASAAATPTTPSATAQATASPTDTDGVNQSVFELTVGTCINNPSEEDQIQSVQSVPCDMAHDNEVFALVQFPAGEADPFPGQQAITDFATAECQGQAFTDYVGIEWANSRFFTTQLTPTDGSWAQGDREIVCLLYDPTAPSTGSARGSAQ